MNVKIHMIILLNLLSFGVYLKFSQFKFVGLSETVGLGHLLSIFKNSMWSWCSYDNKHLQNKLINLFGYASLYAFNSKSAPSIDLNITNA